MSETEPNWIERKARREAVLNDQSNTVWQAVRSAIQDCCDTFYKYYCNPGLTEREITCEPENGHRFRVTRKVLANRITTYQDTKHTALIEFDEGGKCIRVTVDNKSPMIFLIDADDSRAFATHNKQEISPDDLSRKALEDLMFGKEQNTRMITQPTRPSGAAGGPSGWMS